MIPTPDLTSPQPLDGRTVREIVEHNHEMVSQAWCLRIVRQVLQSLEVQYGMRMPHRLITPDTLLILDSGDPMLLPSGDEAPDAPPHADEARDVHDLAAVVYYAITLELGKPTRLAGRAPDEYSAGFVAAIDDCLAPDPAARPHTIEQLRALLGIAVLGAPVAAPPPMDDDVVPPVAPVQPRATEPMPGRPSAPDATPIVSAIKKPGRGRRWPLIAGIVLVLLAALIALFALLRQADTNDAVALLPPVQEAPVIQPEPDPAPPLVTLTQGEPEKLDGPVIDEANPTPPSKPPAAPDAVVPPTAVRLAPQGARPGAAAGTTYKLLIRPWGTIVVDGVDRGASPPLKHITLPPGAHTIRIVNPNFPEHSVAVQSVQGQTGTIELDFTEEETP